MFRMKQSSMAIRGTPHPRLCPRLRNKIPPRGGEGPAADPEEDPIEDLVEELERVGSGSGSVGQFMTRSQTTIAALLHEFDLKSTLVRHQSTLVRHEFGTSRHQYDTNSTRIRH